MDKLIAYIWTKFQILDFKYDWHVLKEYICTCFLSNRFKLMHTKNKLLDEKFITWMKCKFIATPLTVFDVEYGCEYNGKLNRKYEYKDLEFDSFSFVHYFRNFNWLHEFIELTDDCIKEYWIVCLYLIFLFHVWKVHYKNWNRKICRSKIICQQRILQDKNCKESLKPSTWVYFKAVKFSRSFGYSLLWS